MKKKWRRTETAYIKSVLAVTTDNEFSDMTILLTSSGEADNFYILNAVWSTMLKRSLKCGIEYGKYLLWVQDLGLAAYMPGIYYCCIILLVTHLKTQAYYLQS